MAHIKCREFKEGDAVRVSAAFLRSICPAAAKGWPTKLDPGKGHAVEVLPCGQITFVSVWWFEIERLMTYNAANLIHEKDTYNEAMRAEHHNS